MTDTEVRYAKGYSRTSRSLRGLDLGAVYVEEIRSWLSAFEALDRAVVKDL